MTFARKVVNPLRTPMDAGELAIGKSHGCVVSVADLLARVGDSTQDHVFSFSRGYGLIQPAEYAMVEKLFLGVFDGRKEDIGTAFGRVRELSRELLANAFKYGVRNPFGGTVKFNEYESGTHYAFCLLDDGDGIPLQVVRGLSDESSPDAFLYREGLHGNCYRKLKSYLRQGVVEAVAFPEDRKGLYLLVKKAKVQ